MYEGEPGTRSYISLLKLLSYAYDYALTLDVLDLCFIGCYTYCHCYIHKAQSSYLEEACMI